MGGWHYRRLRAVSTARGKCELVARACLRLLRQSSASPSVYSRKLASNTSTDTHAQNRSHARKTAATRTRQDRTATGPTGLPYSCTAARRPRGPHLWPCGVPVHPAPTGTRPRALQSRGSCTSPKTRTVHTNNTPPPSPAGPTPTQLRLAYDLCRRGNDCLPPRSVEHRSLTGPRPQPGCCGRGTRRGNRRGPPA